MAGGDDRPHAPGTTHEQITPQEFYQGMREDIDPLKHAGEGFFATEEYARPEDIADPFVRNDVGKEGDYYPPLDMSLKGKARVKANADYERYLKKRYPGIPLSKAKALDEITRTNAEKRSVSQQMAEDDPILMGDL